MKCHTNYQESNKKRLYRHLNGVFNEAEPTATVTTYNSTLIRKLDGLCSTRPDDVQLTDTDSVGGKTYAVPKKWIKVNASLILTEEQRRERSERGKRAISNLHA